MVYLLVMKKTIFFLFIILFMNTASFSDNYYQPQKKLFFISPNNGDEVTSPVAVKFGIEGMKIVPAGINEPMSGHHHLLVNINKLPNMKMPIPSDENHLHFGKGQTETVLELPKGKHTLQLLLGDYLHIPHDVPILSEKIEIIVK